MPGTCLAADATRAARLSDVELAALNGGAQLAVVTALAALRDGHLTQAGGTLAADGRLPADAGELERELFAAIRRTPGRPGTEIVRDAVDGDAVRRILARLTADGLLLGERAAARMRVLWLAAVAFATAGTVAALALALAGASDLLVPTAIAAATPAMIAVTCWTGRRRSGPTAAGRRVLRELIPARWEEPRRDRAGLAFTVATAGTAALWATAPSFAAELGLPAATQTAVGVHAMLTAAGCGGCGGGCGGCGCG